MVWKHFATIKEKKGVSDAEFTRDIKDIIILGVMKGNLTEKNKKKMSEDGRKKAEALFTKWDLHMGSVEGLATAVSLPRVLSAFPVATTKAVVKLPARTFGPVSSGFPAVISNPVFPALVPQTLHPKLVQSLLGTFNLWATEQSRKISKVMAAKSFAEVFSIQMEYTTISHCSPVPSAEDRANMWPAVAFQLREAEEVLLKCWSRTVEIEANPFETKMIEEDAEKGRKKDAKKGKGKQVRPEPQEEDTSLDL
jgi:hypothetical protein